MNDLHLENLEQVHAWLERRISFRERQERLKPIRELMLDKMEFSRSSIPELTADSRAKARLSALALEKTLSQFPQKERASDDERQSVLDAARRRTRALEMWLETLS